VIKIDEKNQSGKYLEMEGVIGNRKLIFSTLEGQIGP
jgi:hypothetical protein